jgi:hypothetical protein
MTEDVVPARAAFPDALQLAQVNVSVARARLDDPAMRGFVYAFDRVARLAAVAPGFVWHWRPDSDELLRDGDDLLVVNLSVWTDYASLHDFVYRGEHGPLVLRGRKWFRESPRPSTALWWVAPGTRPSVEDGLARLRHLRAHGPMPQAFSLLHQFDPEGRPVRSRS